MSLPDYDPDDLDALRPTITPLDDRPPWPMEPKSCNITSPEPAGSEPHNEPATESTCPSPTSSPKTPESEPGSPSSSSASAPTPSESAPSTPENSPTNYRRIPLHLIDADPNQNDRLDAADAHLDWLTADIQARGQRTPILVRSVADRYELVAGYRRVAALRRLGTVDVVAQIIQAPDDVRAIERYLENACRSNLTPLEEAAAVADIVTTLAGDVDAAAARLNRSRAWIDARLELVNLDPRLTRLLHDGSLSAAAARELNRITNDDALSIAIQSAETSGINARTARYFRQQADSLITSPPLNLPARELPAAAGDPPTVMIACYSCEVPWPMTDCRTAWLCPDCIAAIRTAKAP